MDSTITTETNQVIVLFTCLRGCRRASDGTDGTCLLTSHHLQEMMDEDLENRAIEAMPVVRSLCFHAADAKNKAGYRVNVRCDCGTKQVGSVRKSSKRATFGDCLRELGRLIQQDHGPTCVATALCQKTIQLLVSRMLARARARTWIPVKWRRSLGVRLYAF